ncbi:DUF1330 domain-containing protein [uncultured Jannaschia sp.]|uniref:DUF1330 domain-containing protein n=1 Tax=uncultured Jannaschia sp. TaxID=293347 RepID=UPI0026190242|nr:DUF1330 domain-containing protein [uncultured Jannaschia sp.]
MSRVVMVVSPAVSDMEALLRDYAGPIQAINARHGVETLAVAPQAEMLEGEAGGVLAILRFPDRAAFDAWSADPDNAPLRARRQALFDPARSFVAIAQEAMT